MLLSYLFILSFIWSIYFIIRTIKEKKYIEYLNKSRELSSRDVCLTKFKNCQRKVVKSSFLIAINTTECVIVFSFLLLVALKNRKHITRVGLVNGSEATVTIRFLDTVNWLTAHPTQYI